MSTPTHTPGPWRFWPIVSGYRVAGKPKDGSNCFVADVTTPEMGVNMQDNARLIAAAPDLLAALRPFANYACEVPNDCHNCKARAAIAKATGSTS